MLYCYGQILNLEPEIWVPLPVLSIIDINLFMRPRGWVLTTPRSAGSFPRIKGSKLRNETTICFRMSKPFQRTRSVLEIQ